jgi:hypothetical protein
VQRQLCALFAHKLKPGSYLFLGSPETADATPEFFRPLDREARVYQAKASAGQAVPLLPQMPREHHPPMRGRQAAVRHEPARVLEGQHAAALEQAAPPSVLVDDARRVLHLSPTAGRFFQSSAALFRTELPALVRPELRLDLQLGLQRAFERGEAWLSLPVPVAFEGAKRRVMLHVLPVGGDEHPQALVLFLDAGPFQRDDAGLQANGVRSEDVRRRLRAAPPGAGARAHAPDRAHVAGRRARGAGALDARHVLGEGRRAGAGGGTAGGAVAERHDLVRHGPARACDQRPQYGSLSVPEGRVEVVWTLEQDAAGAEHLRFVWHDHGGPNVTPPEHNGSAHGCWRRGSRGNSTAR